MVLLVELLVTQLVELQVVVLVVLTRNTENIKSTYHVSSAITLVKEQMYKLRDLPRKFQTRNL